MKRLIILIVLCAFVILSSTIFAFPSIYPTGTTIYKPEKCWNGYTIMSNNPGPRLFDMNGNVVKEWDIPLESDPLRILPGGYLMTPTNNSKGVSLAQVDWDGNTVWEFNKFEKMPAPKGAEGPALKIYRAYRVPYDWVPQLIKPKEIAVIPFGNQNFKVQGTGDNYKGYVKQ